MLIEPEETEEQELERERRVLGLSSWKHTFATFKRVKGSENAYRAFYAMSEGTAKPLLLCYGGVGNGKCLGKGTKVIMANGELRNVESIQEGDKILGTKGEIKTVSGLSKGYGQLYQVKQNSGIDYTVNGNHILYLKKSIASKKDKGKIMPSGNQRRPRGRYPDYSDEVCISVEDYLKQSARWKENFYGYRASVNFPYKYTCIEPYFLGVWLGDGDSTTSVITTADEEIKQYIYDYAQRKKLTVSVYDEERTPRYRIKGNTRLMRALRIYDLLGNKHIPPEYLYNSKMVRLQVLAGIVDTDGHLNTNCYEVTQKSRRLAEDIRYLCHSLGLRCSISLEKKGIKSIGFVGEYYRLNISGDIQSIPVKLPRRKPTNIRKNKNPSITSIKVDYIGEGEFFGFDLGGDGLFLLEDFTVTHNTHLCEALVIELFNKQIRCQITVWSELMRKFMRAMWNKDPTAKSYYDMFDQFKSRDRVVLDDVGLGGSDDDKGRQWGELEDIINYRYRERMFTVLVTNKELKKLPERVVRRFNDPEVGIIVLNEAPDYWMNKMGGKG